MTKRRSGFLVAKNDHLIDDIKVNPLYEIRPNGEIWTLVCQTGKVSAKGVWRRAGRLNRRKPGTEHLGSYWDISYKGKRLSIHRIIYSKFNGPLSPDLVFDHIDGNTLNNHPSNLQLITQQENSARKFSEK